MSIKDYTEEQISEMSMLEVGYELLAEQKSPEEYHGLLKRVGDIKNLNDELLTNRISHLYTEMSVDGRFVNIGDNRWGLRSWYPFDQTEEELSQAATKARKKRAKDKEEEDDHFDEDAIEVDEFEDLEDELDDLANEDDTDFDELDDDDEEEFPAAGDDKDLEDDSEEY
ncbi:DNA-directed RNA polymerase subunit delta [Salipaludibacillus neizhouensis]|uniref:Probable DNA-directed RNA polymerase subunit delta n=1 Tax=Salipaludibacillus neizhouensis TaxID=885475 RepID=A0A3A9K4J7_9BACI|nr:DNA-directed RNA polymerase subunit delta [Salipaludibacillus neizhouensis]RKL67974.1 DNA-directed RNA polymerase subunit delta [Salipaludibacillus neizhouensis]